MRAWLLLLPALAVLALSVSCGDDEDVTQLVLAIDTDIEALNRIEARVDFFSDERVASNAIRPDRQDLPHTLGIVHEGGMLGPIVIRVTGFMDNDQVAVQRLVQVSFVKGRTMLLRVELTQDCVEVFERCSEEAEQTCLAGSCRTAVVPAEALEPYTGDPSRSVVSVSTTAPNTPTDDMGDGSTPPATVAGSDDAPGPIDAGPVQTPGDAGDDAAVPDPPTPPENPCADPAFALITPECHVLGGSCTGTGNDRVCELVCEVGWGNCDGDPATGCEADLGSDALHCGECGVACPAMAPNALGCSCEEGERVLFCATAGPFPIPLFADCDGLLDNGCEANLTSDEHCGRCNRQCSCQNLTCAQD